MPFSILHRKRGDNSFKTLTPETTNEPFYFLFCYIKINGVSWTLEGFVTVKLGSFGNGLLSYEDLLICIVI
jgi:hypothetical protein